MKVAVNGESLDVEARTLDALVAELGHEVEHVATAVNGDFIPRTERAAAFLKDGDRIEVLTPMQGG